MGEGLENAITSISIKNVYGSGTYSVAEEKWTPTGEANGAYTLTIDSKNTSEGTELTEGENIFMMIPQTLPEDATIEVTYKDEESGEEQTLIASIAEKEWTKGYTVTYILSRMEILEEYHFKITPELTVDYRGKNNIEYSISSYKNRTVNGVTENNIPVKWKYIAYKENDGEWITPTNRPYYPQWLGSFYTSGTGERTEYTIKVDGSGSQYKNKQNEILQATNSVEDIYDLSTRGGETNVNTANCYIVNAPGTYSLPLVYGNAIKNGQPNESAYQTANTSETILSTFINHLGREITSPYIYENSDAEDNKLVPQSAELLWQDAQNLVTDVKLSSDKESLQFTVAKETIQQGNAVLAIRDNKEQIMWSWHIWVTDYNPYEEKEKENITTGRHFFSRYLGWCYLSSNFHEQRTVTLRFEQEESGEKIEMTITQTEHQDGTNGNNPYYQFGRKDPQLPAQNCGVERTENKTWYDTNGNSSRELLLMPEGTEVNGKHPDNIMVNIVDFILNPHKTYIKYRYDTKHYYLLNLWDMERDDSEEINSEVSHKTIYDPSPVGYQVPSSGILTNYPNKDDLVLCGYRGTDAYTSGAYNFGDLREVDKSYNVWSASSLNKSSAWHIYSTNSYHKNGSSDKANGLAVLPVSEE